MRLSSFSTLFLGCGSLGTASGATSVTRAGCEGVEVRTLAVGAFWLLRDLLAVCRMRYCVCMGPYARRARTLRVTANGIRALCAT